MNCNCLILGSQRGHQRGSSTPKTCVKAPTAVAAALGVLGPSPRCCSPRALPAGAAPLLTQQPPLVSGVTFSTALQSQLHQMCWVRLFPWSPVGGKNKKRDSALKRLHKKVNCEGTLCGKQTWAWGVFLLESHEVTEIGEDWDGYNFKTVTGKPTWAKWSQRGETATAQGMQEARRGCYDI